MRDILEAVAAGELSVQEAEAKLAGYATTDAGRFDAAREQRRGAPEAILAQGKTPAAVGELAAAAVETTGRAIVTRPTAAHQDAVRATMPEDAEMTVTEDGGPIVVHDAEFVVPELDAEIGIVTAGTSDIPIAAEAAVIAREMGAAVVRIDDIGVAGLHRMLDRVDDLRAMDVLVVAAGREGALPTVIAGLVDTPVIGLPVSIGYGHGGQGESAILGMLQSCSVVSVVNIDAGFVAGAQAGLIARAIDSARADA